MSQIHRLESVHLHEVGVFDDVQIEFKPIASAEEDAKKAEIHLFTGPNGCGKSTVLYALARAFAVLKYGSLPLINTRFRKKNKKEGNVSINFAGDRKSYSFETNGTVFIFPAFAYSGRRDLEDSFLSKGIKEVKISAYEDAASFKQSIKPQTILQWIANNRTQYALAVADGDDQDAATYGKALDRIVQLVSNVCDLDVEFKLERSPLTVSLKMNGESLSFDALPDGLKSIISWIADLSMRLEQIEWDNENDIFSQPIILFLDEIDIHLHPKWQRRILPAVQKLLPNAQIFASTHSPFVVGSVEDAWVYCLPEPVNGHNSGTIEGVPSAAGKSYQLILEEIFDIDEEFDIETEQLVADFYEARKIVLKTKNGIDQLLQAAQPIVERSKEAGFIVERELRQLSRLLGQEISLAQN